MNRPAPAAVQPPAVRLPTQDRSRLAWQRILDAGVDVLCELGVTRFNVSAVCERAGVAMTAVYARVESRDDLLHAVYDHGVAGIQATELSLITVVTTPSARAAVDVLAGVFARHAQFLRPTILGASDDAYLLARGEENISRARELFIATAVGADASADVQERAATLFTVALSTLAFDLAFGPSLVRGRSQDDPMPGLRTIADTLLPDRVDGRVP